MAFQVQVVDFADNLLTGTIPDSELGALEKLVHLELSGNELTGSLPAEIMARVLGHQAFHTLDLARNQLTGSIPLLPEHFIGRNETQKEVGGPPPMKQPTHALRLSHNLITGTIPSALGLLSGTGWTGIYLHHNNLQGTIPSELGLLEQLLFLNLESNVLSSTIPTELGQLTSIEEFSVAENRLSGTLPHQLCQLNATLDFDCIPGQLLCGCDCECI
jgi:Leucine-rich repeat (LRR) protein